MTRWTLVLGSSGWRSLACFLGSLCWDGAAAAEGVEERSSRPGPSSPPPAQDQLRQYCSAFWVAWRTPRWELWLQTDWDECLCMDVICFDGGVDVDQVKSEGVQRCWMRLRSWCLETPADSVTAPNYRKNSTSARSEVKAFNKSLMWKSAVE